MDTEVVYRLLKSASPEERVAFFSELRPRISTDRLAELRTTDPERLLAALIPVVVNFCASPATPAGDGAALAEAAHRYALELVEDAAHQDKPKLKLASRWLVDIAVAVIGTLIRRGDWLNAVNFSDHWTPIYRRLDKSIDLSLLKRQRDEALVRLKQQENDAKLEQTGAFEVDKDEMDGDAFDFEAVPSDDAAVESADDFLGVEAPSMPRPPSSPAPGARPASKSESSERQASPDEAFPLAVGRKPAPPISTGFANVATPGQPLESNLPIVPGERYFFWLEVAEVVGSIEAMPTPLPIDLLPDTAVLTVVLFAPDAGLHSDAAAAIGELELQAGSATVLRQPMGKDLALSKDLLARRLLFPVRAIEPGEARLRCSIYCQGVLVQSRLVHVAVGDTARVSRVDYTLATRLDAKKLAALDQHRFSLHLNHGLTNNHDFYFYGAPGSEPYVKSISVNANRLDGLLQTARAALQRASWGDEQPWQADKSYRYEGKPDIERLRLDLAVLAIAGYRIFDELVNQLAGGKEHVAKLRELVAAPGFVQISADAELGLVLPAALIYDQKISLRTPAAKLQLCAEFTDAYRQKTPLTQTACFQGRCPSKADDQIVCPSGFWGFRHALGLPFANAYEDDAKEASFDTRIEYADVPVLVVGVSQAPDLPRTIPHTEELLALRPDWGKRAWLVRNSLDPLLYAMRSSQPHLVYMYCHSSGRPVGSAEIPMLYLGATPNAPQPGEWLEKATLRDEVEWSQPRPLVFLNGCHTTKLDTDTILNFVTGFVENANACGVVGTEITVFEKLAGAFATHFLKRFFDGAKVGQAIRDARLDLLQDGNPLGLVYTPFVLGGTRLVKSGAP